MAVYYIGSFPPVYGGVTIKNENLYNALRAGMDVRRIDMNRIKRGNLWEMLRFVWAMATGKQYIIGLAGQKNRRRFTNLMYRFKRRAMERSVLLVMGGVVEDVTGAGPGFLRRFDTYARTYVELPGMLEKLEAAGIRNCAIYPNCRPRPADSPAPETGNGSLRCVFFSNIQPEKGVDLILQTARELPEMTFHFYGELRKDYAQTFLEEIRHLENATYHGVFSGKADAVYRQLSQYDVLLLPTRWKAEGLPGILVEAKIAGVPAVVSDHNFNREIVRQDYDGIVIPEITARKLADALEALECDREKLRSMQRACRESAEEYYLDNCVQEIISGLLER